MTREAEANALRHIAEGIYMYADALFDQPELPPSGVGSAGRAAPATGSPPTTFSDGLPVEEPPLFPDGFEAQPSLADESVEFSAPRPVAERDAVLGECPDHQTRWRAVPGGVSKRTGQSYQAFWACEVKDCKKRPDKAWQRTHNPEAVAA